MGKHLAYALCALLCPEDSSVLYWSAQLLIMLMALNHCIRALCCKWQKPNEIWLEQKREFVGSQYWEVAVVKLVLGFDGSGCSTYIFIDLSYLYLLVFCRLCLVHFWSSAPYIIAKMATSKLKIIFYQFSHPSGRRVFYVFLSH